MYFMYYELVQIPYAKMRKFLSKASEAGNKRSGFPSLWTMEQAERSLSPEFLMQCCLLICKYVHSLRSGTGVDFGGGMLIKVVAPLPSNRTL